MDYLTLDALRARVRTDLTDAALSAVITQQSAAITLALGAEPNDPMSEEFSPGPTEGVWLTFRPASVTEVRDLDAVVLLDPMCYRLVGRLLLPASSWPRCIRVTYSIADRAALLALLEGVCLDLCRLAVTDMGGEQSEQIGDYRHEAKDVQAERAKVLARLNTIRGIRPALAR